MADVPILQRPQGYRIPVYRFHRPFSKAASADLSEVFHCIVLISDGNGRTRICQAECRARTVLKLDSKVSISLLNGFHYAPHDTAAAPAVLIFMLD